MRPTLSALSFALLALGCAQSPRADRGDEPRQPVAGAVDLSRDSAARSVGAAAAPDQASCFASARPEPVPVNRRSPLSPADSVCVMVGGATVAVRYARPSMRGRQIFGGLEKYDRVWRAGANAATSFTTTRDLAFGDVTVPAGDYTLFVYLEEAPNMPACAGDGTGGSAIGAGWKLVLSKQVGQWGTEYNQAQDLARIPLRMCRPQTPVEQFEIRLTPRGAGAGTLTLAWENTSASADFRPRS